MFIHAGANQLIECITFIGFIDNSEAIFFLRKQASFLDTNFISPELIPDFSISSSQIKKKVSDA
jgi:hypothetical protein